MSAEGEEDITDFLINFFNQTPEFKIPVNGKHLKTDSRRRFLVLLEDVEDLVTQDGIAFKRFLKEIFESC